MNIVELIDANAKNYPNKIALCNPDDELTFKQLKEKSEQAADQNFSSLMEASRL